MDPALDSRLSNALSSFGRTTQDRTYLTPIMLLFYDGVSTDGNNLQAFIHYYRTSGLLDRDGHLSGS